MRCCRWIVGAGAWMVILCVYGGCLLALAILGRLRRREPTPGRDGLCLLLTGRFDSYNWSRAHLQPLADAECVREIVCVVDGPTISHPKLQYAQPPAWLRLILGRALSKALWLLRIALKQQPDVVMGYHIFPGALSAVMVARICGAQSVYQMTAGPVEIIGGGINTENPLLGRLSRPSALLERLALGLCNQLDVIVVRGDRARSFLLSKAVRGRVSVIAGSFDPARFQNRQSSRVYDLVYVGRLMPIKQPSHILRVVAAVSHRHPDVRAIIVGDGPLLSALKREAQALGVSRNIEFMGHVERVEEVLTLSKVILLTSRSEGLSIGLAEAMAAGVVPVVGDVGDLAQLVRNGRTGWRVSPGDFEAYAARIDAVLCDGTLRARLSDAARIRAHENNSLAAITGRWQQCLTDMTSPRSCAAEGRKPSVSERREKSVTNAGAWSSRLYAAWTNVPRSLKTLLRPLDRVPPQFFLGYHFRRHLRFVQKSEHWPRERVRSFQLQRLRQICSLANEKSDFYRTRFQSLGFEPSDLRDFSDFGALPTIDKNQLRNSLERMCTVSPRAAGVDTVSTGGTGGVPVRFFINADRSAVEYAHLTQCWRRAGYRIGMRLVVLRGRVVRADRTGLHHEYDPLLRHHYYSSFHLTDDNMRRYLEHISGVGACFLHAYPSTVAALARYVRRSGMPPADNIRGILTESECVYPQQRALVEQVFGCRYFSCYGHSEKLILAAECEHSTDYHVCPTYGYCELLDEKNRPVTTPGQRGELVGTGFINTVAPFIRYRTGDYATYVGERCEACGRECTIIRDIHGHRTQEHLVAMDGSEISWTALNMHDDTFVQVRRFQFHQVERGRAVLKLVPTAQFSDRDRHTIIRNLGKKLDGRLTIAVELVEAISLSQTGKAIYVDQEIDIER